MTWIMIKLFNLLTLDYYFGAKVVAKNYEFPSGFSPVN